jgi:hypothetical protein
LTALAAAALVGGLSCSFLLAKPGKVVTKQGVSFEGEVQDRRKEQGVVVVTTGDKQKVEVKASNVDRVEYAEEPAPDDPNATGPDAANPPTPPAAQPGSVEADLRNRLASYPKNDVNDRIKLARDALQRHEYGVARDSLDQVLQVDPRNQQAKDLMTTVDAQQRLDQRAQNPDAPHTPPGNRPPGAAAAGSGPSPDVMPPLSPDDINRIRQREWTRNDKGVKVRFVGDVKRRFVAANRIAPADFNNMNALEQAWQMVSKGDDEIRNEVRLTTDPIALRDYRAVIQRAVLPTCATAACHGGGPAGKFQLYPKADHEGEAYANFLTLSTYTYTPKTPPLLEGAGPGGPAATGPGAGAPGAQPGAQPGGQPAAQPGTPRGAGAGSGTGAGTGPGGGAGGPPPAAGAGGVPARGPGGGGGGALAAGRSRAYHVIDRDRPADSLLLQFALPANLADHPHPEVPGFKPIFRVLKDPRYEQFLKWVSNELSPLQSDYGIKPGDTRGGQGPDVTRGAGQQPPQPGGTGQGQPGQGQPGQRQPQGQGQPQNPPQNPAGGQRPQGQRAQ